MTPSTTAPPTNLALFRFAQGLSTAELAKRCSMSRAGLNNLQNGKYAPKLKTAQRISAALGIPISDIFPDVDLT